MARHQAETAAEESEQLYRLVFQHAADAIFIMDVEGHILDANPAACQRLGYSREDFLHRVTFQDLLSEENLALVPARREQLLRDGHITFETAHRRKDGTTIQVEQNGCLIHYQNQPAILTIARDITLRRRAEAELHRHREQLESLVAARTAELQASVRTYQELAEALPEVVFEMDARGNLRFVNRRAFSTFGYTLEEFAQGLNALQMIAPEDRERAQTNIGKALAGDTTEHEYQMLRKDGTAFPGVVYPTPIYRDGRSAGLRGIIVDVTERKQAEAEKARLQEQLYQAQKIDSVGRLAGGIAHDFNNLLSPILGYTEMALRNLAPEEPLYRNLERVYAAAEQAREVTRRVLAFSRKQVLELQPLNLNESVEELVKILRHVIGEDITVVTHLDPALGTVRADPSQIQQVLMNLAVNARDAMPDGGRLSFATGNVETDQQFAKTHVGLPPGSYVWLAVRDTGKGMDAETQRHLFEPFFTTKERGQGTGLGLATVYGIVKQHGGGIWAYSRPGQGASLEIYLPRVEAAAQAVAPVSTNVRGVRGNETVLVVEDEEAVRKLVCDILTAYGYLVLEAADPEQALSIAAAATAPIHLLLTDVIMPQMNGKELYSQLIKLHPDLKTLYMSGYPENIIAHHGVLEAGIQFIQKPFRIYSLTAKVRETLDR